MIEPGFVDTPLTQKNDFAMPFLLSAEVAAARVSQAIAAGKLRYRFPTRLALTLQILNCLPYGLRQKVATGLQTMNLLWLLGFKLCWLALIIWQQAGVVTGPIIVVGSLRLAEHASPAGGAGGDAGWHSAGFCLGATRRL